MFVANVATFLSDPQSWCVQSLSLRLESCPPPPSSYFHIRRDNQCKTVHQPYQFTTILNPLPLSRHCPDQSHLHKYQILTELLISFYANFYWASRCLCFIIQLRHLKVDIKNSFQTRVLAWQPLLPLQQKRVSQISLKTQLPQEQICPSTSLQLSCLVGVCSSP